MEIAVKTMICVFNKCIYYITCVIFIQETCTTKTMQTFNISRIKDNHNFYFW